MKRTDSQEMAEKTSRALDGTRISLGSNQVTRRGYQLPDIRNQSGNHIMMQRKAEGFPVGTQHVPTTTQGTAVNRAGRAFTETMYHSHACLFFISQIV